MEVKHFMYAYIGCIVCLFVVPLLMFDTFTGYVAITHLNDTCNTLTTPVPIWLLIVAGLIFVIFWQQIIFQVLYVCTGKRIYHICQIVNLVFSLIISIIMFIWACYIFFKVYTDPCYQTSEFIMILMYIWSFYHLIDFMLCIPMALIFSFKRTMGDISTNVSEREKTYNEFWI